MKAFLILENGRVFTGTSIGSEKEVISEIVFTNLMTGYLETLTDPSYAGQAVVMTYPLIGNYGIAHVDAKSNKVWPVGLIVREVSRKASNFRSEETLESYLKKNDVTCITGIDTRALTRIIRSEGTMNGLITTNENFNLEEVKAQLAAYKFEKAVKKVTCREKVVITHDEFKPDDLEMAKMSYMATEDMVDAIANAKAAGVSLGEIAMCADMGTEGIEKLKRISENKKEIEKHRKIVLVDFGCRNSLLHCLLKRGCDVTIVPADTSADDILSMNPDGILLSNGPGNPDDYPEITTEVKKLCDSNVPIFAVCIGHQFAALANGFKVVKMKCGHKGSYSVKDTKNGRVYFATQNHSYVVTMDSIDETIAGVRFVNTNDKTVEGLSYKNKKILTVQFHPESADIEFLFDDFMNLIG